MSASKNKALVEQFVHEIINQSNLAAADQFVAPDYVELEPFPGQEQGLEGLRRWYATYLAAFPDARWTLEEQIAEGDKVVSRYTWHGTHKVEFLGIPPTNRHVTVSTVLIHRVANAKLSEGRILLDEYGLFRQLGEIPPRGGTRRG